MMSRLPLTQLVLGTLAGIGLFSSLLAQPGWADPNTDVKPLQDFEPQQSKDPFSRSAQGDSFGMLDLIRRATQGTNRSVGDYSAEQDENLDAAASQFRARQQQRIQGQQGTQENSITVTTPNVGH